VDARNKCGQDDSIQVDIRRLSRFSVFKQDALRFTSAIRNEFSSLPIRRAKFATHDRERNVMQNRRASENIIASIQVFLLEEAYMNIIKMR